MFIEAESFMAQTVNFPKSESGMDENQEKKGMFETHFNIEFS